MMNNLCTTSLHSPSAVFCRDKRRPPEAIAQRILPWDVAKTPRTRSAKPSLDYERGNLSQAAPAVIQLHLKPEYIILHQY